MSSAETVSPELAALVARMRWPVPAVKWWVMQELALLLTSPAMRATTEDALLHELACSRFETETVEILFVFWLANLREQSYVCPQNVGCRVAARSPLSDLLLRSICPTSADLGAYLSPLTKHPSGSSPTSDFLAAETQAFPRVLRSDLRFIEERTGLPLQTQFAYEWQASLARVADHSHRIDHFLESPRDQYTGQFYTEQSARARSAFLRTLAVAGEFGGIPSQVLELFSLSTLPLDPCLAWLQPRLPVEGLKLSNPETPAVDVEEHVRSVLSSVSKAGLVGAISWSAEFAENVRLDATATLWTGPDLPWPESLPLSELVEPYVGMLMGEGLSPAGTCERSKSGAQSAVPEGFRPLAGRVNPRRFGYMQAELINRGIFAPTSAGSASPVKLVPSGDRLKYVREDADLAQFGYWNTSWRPSYPLGGKPRCGTYLLLLQAPVEPMRIYVWRCTRFAAKQGYGAMDKSESFGTIALADVSGENDG
ncbi:hypothetical protein [Chitinibacter tainanensis]|uniref:hypothetical protein n=1 Tax=Chitinibacter tainanensis TaxID=230667 RepID=UPI0023528B94|nr:hypothetical protein [Chitinibacter tainanensis]